MKTYAEKCRESWQKHPYLWGAVAFIAMGANHLVLPVPTLYEFGWALKDFSLDFAQIPAIATVLGTTLPWWGKTEHTV